NTGKTITALNINYTGEQWRSARPATPQHMLSFWYATGADPSAFNLLPKSDAGWTNVKELDFYGPVFYAAGSGLDGNAPANKRYLFATIPVTIPDKGYVMLRWKDMDEFENDHGLAIDDFSMTWSTSTTVGPIIMPVELVSFTGRQVGQEIQLNWATASEHENKHFIVERSQDAKAFETIAAIAGKGSSSIRSAYSYTDQAPLQGIAYYRLKQVDLDGTQAYSKIIAVNMQFAGNAILYPTIATDFINLEVTTPGAVATAYDVTGRQVLQQQLSPDTRKYVLDVSKLQAGSYSLMLLSPKGERQVLRFVKR
ncbi:MAG TPA: T9SS C-terminal target domain-containing protein, partial [Pontibacter sp.]